MKLNRKGYSRIYVDNKDNIKKVKEIIKQLDEFEYEYLPPDLIAEFIGKIDYVYNHKFDSIDMDDLMKACWIKGIHAFYVVDEKYPNVP